MATRMCILSYKCRDIVIGMDDLKEPFACIASPLRRVQ